LLEPSVIWESAATTRPSRQRMDRTTVMAGLPDRRTGDLPDTLRAHVDPGRSADLRNGPV
jgi:hypothetical protein